jgi:hypothetical protein
VIQCSGRLGDCKFSRLTSSSWSGLCSYATGLLPLNTSKDGRNVVCGTPPILQDIEAELSGGVDVGMKHLAQELDLWWLVWVLLLELHHEPKCAVLEGRVGGADDDSVPRHDIVWDWGG